MLLNSTFMLSEKDLCVNGIVFSHGLTQTHFLIDCFLYDFTIDIDVRHIGQTMVF